MTPAKGNRTWTIPNDLAKAVALSGEAMEWVESFPVSEHSRYATRLVLEELLTNTIKYAYPDGKPHLISVRVNISNRRIQVELVDDGEAFDPTAQAGPDLETHFDGEAAGGLGLELVRQLTHRMEYHRDPPNNHLHLQIPTDDPDEDPAGSDSPAGPSEEPAP